MRVSISVYLWHLLWLALFLASSDSLAPGIWPHLPGQAGSLSSLCNCTSAVKHSWRRSLLDRRTGTIEDACSLSSTDLCLSTLAQPPVLPSVFSSVAIPEHFCAPLSSSKALFFFNDICYESHLVQNREWGAALQQGICHLLLHSSL